MYLKTVISFGLVTLSAAVSAKPGMGLDPISMALPRVLTQCEAPLELSDELQQANSAESPSISPAGQGADKRHLALVLMANRYEVYFGEAILGDGGTVAGAAGNGTPIHIVLNRNNAAEHFLFSLNTDGSGELLWASEAASTLTTCKAVAAP